jgi:hypothetical protein
MGFNIPKFNLPKFNLPNISLPKINLPRINLPKVNFPNPQQIFGTTRSSNASQTRTAPKPNLFQRVANFGRSFSKDPIGATVRLHQKAANKVFQSGINRARDIKRATVSNFKRFENWADKGIKSNHKWSQQNRNSGNLLNRITANANLGFTKVAKTGNNVINRSSTFYRGLRKSNNWLVKGAGYAGGLATAIGRGLASPVTFADPRLSGKQRTGQVVDGVLSYIPVGKIVGLGGKVLKPVGRQILGFGGKIVKPIGTQISQRAPWLIKGGAKVIGGGKNVIGKVGSSKGSQFVKNKLVTPFVNRIAKPTVQGYKNINKTLNRKITFKDVRNLPQTIGNKLRGLGKGVKPAVKGNPLRNVKLGTRQRLASSGKLPMTARANAKNSVDNLINQVISGNVPQNARLAKNLQNSLPKQFQGSSETLRRRHGIRSSSRKTTNDFQYNGNLSKGGNNPPLKGAFKPSPNYKKASEIGVITRGTTQWDQAVAAIKNGGVENINNIRVRNGSEAKKLLNDALGKSVKQQPTYAKPKNGTYELHPSEINTAQGIHNDLSHIKFTQPNGRQGHIWFGSNNTTNASVHYVSQRKFDQMVVKTKLSASELNELGIKVGGNTIKINNPGSLTPQVIQPNRSNPFVDGNGYRYQKP